MISFTKSDIDGDCICNEVMHEVLNIMDWMAKNKTLSFDVGIKNLAYCILNNDKTIEHWGIINLDESPQPTSRNTSRDTTNEHRGNIFTNNFFGNFFLFIGN